MENRSALPPDSSSIGARDLGHATVEGALPAVVVEGLPPVGPLLIIGMEEVAKWREKYQLSDDIVAKISEFLGISPGQVNPPSWKTLMALQNLGDLEGLVIGVAKVLHSYFISPLNGGEGRYHLHPHLKDPLVQEVPKRKRKRHPVFESRWTEKFAFMHLPGFSPVWRVAGGL
ncbi:hypothetical protein Bca4012_026673 [Brassica carinata]